LSVCGKGGIAFLWRKSLNKSMLEDLGTDRIGVMEIKSENRETVYVIQAYLPSASESIETLKIERTNPITNYRTLEK
jgi:hypothetical protein